MSNTNETAHGRFSDLIWSVRTLATTIPEQSQRVGNHDERAPFVHDHGWPNAREAHDGGDTQDRDDAERDHQVLANHRCAPAD